MSSFFENIFYRIYRLLFINLIGLKVLAKIFDILSYLDQNEYCIYNKPL
jgi:hypothetical protein